MGHELNQTEMLRGEPGALLSEKEQRKTGRDVMKNKFNTLCIRFLMQLTSEREEGSNKERETELIKVSTFHCGQIYF